MANIPIYIPTYINSAEYSPAKVLPRLLFYNGQRDCERYYIKDSNNAAREINQFPYFDNYNVVSGSFPTTGSKSLLFFNEEAVYGQTPYDSVYSDYWSNYISLIYNPKTKLLNASAIIPLGDYFNIQQNDIVEFRGNYYHLRAINDYNLKNGECSVQLLGPILGDALNLPINVLYPKCLGYDPTDCGMACYSSCECTDNCPTFQFNSTSVSDLIFTIKAEGPLVPDEPTYQFTLPVTTNRMYDFTINWGDGTSSYVSGSNSPNITHTYATGSYTASISGLYQHFDCNTGTTAQSARDVINGVHQFGNTGATKVNFGRTENFINMDLVKGQPGQFTWTDASSLFSGAGGGGITPGNTIKEDLLYYCTNVRLFGAAFQQTRLVNSLPENMFNRCYTGELFNSMFFGCNTFGTISGSFCTMPSGSGFFPSGSYIGFYNMANAFFQFRNIDTLYSSSFDNIITQKNQKQNGYMVATQLFAYSDASGTNPIKGNAPAIWVIPPGGEDPFGTDAFNNCTNLSNYADIPAAYK
jgi:hypothetical protein